MSLNVSQTQRDCLWQVDRYKPLPFDAEWDGFCPTSALYKIGTGTVKRLVSRGFLFAKLLPDGTYDEKRVQLTDAGLWELGKEAVHIPTLIGLYSPNTGAVANPDF